MLFCFQVLALSLFMIEKSVNSVHTSADCPYSLNVTNTDQATVDVPIEVKAELECAKTGSHYYYVFEDDLQTKANISGYKYASTEFTYTGEGPRTVNVKAFSTENEEVASCETSFKVINYIPGTLDIFGNLTEDKNGVSFMTTGSKANISLTLRYSSEVLRESEFSFSWTIGNTWLSTSSSFVTHLFNTSGVHDIRVAVVGRIPSYDGTKDFHYKWGSFNTRIVVKDPVKSINLSGNTYLQHGQLLNLEISCNGSGPIEYCWKLLPSTSNQSILTCNGLVSAPECKFPILYYFQDSGEYNIAIYVNNLVTSLQRNIQVHIYDVSLRPQLSTVIIPVVCSILVVLIIAAALVVHMRRSPQYNVETADFDFMQAEETPSIAMETSWQIMRRSLWQILRFRCIFYSTENASSNSYGTMLVSHGP